MYLIWSNVIKNKFITILYIVFSLLPICSFAALYEGSANAIIDKGNMREAVKNSLNNALISAVKNYYKSTTDNSTASPDVTADYIKFIKSYQITSRRISGYTVTTSVLANIDSEALKDAKLFLNNPKDTALFVFTGIPTKLIEHEDMISMINGAFSKRNFSTNDEMTFLYEISNPEDMQQIKDAYSKFDSPYLFNFSFSPSFINLEDADNSCELTTTTQILYKNGAQKSLRIVTGSSKSNQPLCMTESINKAVNATVDYVRENIIVNQDVKKETYNYKIRAINYPNMVITNKLLSTLKQRGIINDFKTASFSAKEIIFDISSLFSDSDMIQKIRNTNFDIGFSITTYRNGVELDFSKLPEQNEN